MTPAVRLSIGRIVPGRSRRRAWAKRARRARSVECGTEHVTTRVRSFRYKPCEFPNISFERPPPLRCSPFRTCRRAPPRRRNARGSRSRPPTAPSCWSSTVVRSRNVHELPRVCPRRVLPGHGLPPSDRGVHDPGRRVHRRVPPAANPGADPQRGGPRRRERPRNHRHGPDLRSALRHHAVLHQRRRQRFPEPPRAHPPGLGYAVFGRVVEGMDTVDRIAALPTGSGGPFPKDVPREAVVIRDTRVHPVD